MSYVVSVGGDPINPNPYTYSSISITGNITLYWPSNNQSSTYTATNWIDITSSAAYVITMPPANEAGEGQEVVFYNFGSYTVTVNGSTGSGITTVASGETKRIWITDNSTAAGTWRIANIGSGTTGADASMLAGYGLVAQSGQLSQSMQVSTYGTDATLSAGLRSYLAIWTGGAGKFTLTSPATLGNNWFVNVKNGGSGTLNIDANGAQIDNTTDINAAINEGFTIGTDGVEFYTVGRVTPETSSVTQLSKSVAGSSDVTLTSAEVAYSIINFTGILTGNINVIVPATVNQWVMYNNTTGAYTLTVKTAAGTGIAITQSARFILYCDGTNVVRSDTTGSGTVTSVATGTGLTGGPITATGTVTLANTAVTAGTYGGAMGFLTETVDAQGRLTAMAYQARNIDGAGLAVATNGDGVSGNPTITVTAATQANQETATSTATAVTPGRQQFHPSAAKFWARVANSGSASLTAGYNVTSVNRVSTGIVDVTLTTAYSGVTSICPIAITDDSSVNAATSIVSASVIRVTTGSPGADDQDFYIVGFGDQ